jgi:hypothetical protein
MQFHYIVYFDTNKGTWEIEHRPQDFFIDGTVYDPDRKDSWFIPEEGSAEEELEYKLGNLLYTLLDNIPRPE